ncbi:ADP-ribosylarginine hydrolase Tri1-like [Mytilus californianus]|uniref:ADP-ribosylarginine hydrolase Tri1-like n=1 Tax=Mytilus californianus TaxID=6549 RepID=UPI002246EE9C|nr:ADP-ribosylarginine hydrolase Tri1-like [Mytilus californianus]
MDRLGPIRGKLKSRNSPCKRKYQPYTRALRKEVNRVYDQIYAIVYGHCIGDAIGLLTENLTREEAKKKYKEVHNKLEYVHKKILPDVHRRKWVIGDWTEESDHMLLILQSILSQNGEVDPLDFSRKLMEWNEKGFPELNDVCGLGTCPQVKSVISHPQFSEEPKKAAEIVWRDSRNMYATNAAVARTSVIGFHHYNNFGQVIKHTLDICNTTHSDPRCHASCVAVTTVMSLLLQRNERHIKKDGSYNLTGVTEEAFRYASRLLPSYDQVKELKKYMFCETLKALELDEQCKSNYTYKTLGAAMWGLRQKDFRQAIQDIVMEGGDADANAAVAGALLGCKLGIQAIPRTWIDQLGNRLWLDNLLDRYFDILEGRRTTKETTL